MSERHTVRLVLDAGGFVQAMGRIRFAADAHPMSDDESPAEWMRRVIDASYWTPDGWNGDSPEAPSPASDEES